jgi:glycosyltransferase involved in cell wall biosynthesis
MEKMLLCSASQWGSLGYACDLLASSPQLGPLAPKLRAAGYGVFHIPFRSKYRYLLRARFIPEYFRLCRSGYDVVHLHIEAATPIFALLAKLAGVPCIVLTPHSIYDFSGFLRARKFAERFLIRLLGGRYGMISEGVRQCEWERYRNPGVRTWNWFDSSHFRPPGGQERESARQSLGCRPDQFVIVSVGNCHDNKNHSELLRAIASLPRSLEPYYLHVGSGLDEEREKRLAAELGIESKVRFCGSQEDPRPFLWAADVFAMPSRREGLGISAIEAIACGVPAVLSGVKGLLEVAAGTEGTVFTTTAAESIAAGLVRIAAVPADESRRRALADSERVRKEFSIEKGVRSIVEGLYQDRAPQSHSGREEYAL